MPNREPTHPIAEIPQIFRATLMDFEMVAHARETIERSLRILNESRLLAAYPAGRYRDRSTPSIHDYASHAMESPGAEVPNN